MTKDFFIRFGITFSITSIIAFITNTIIIYLWNLIRYGEGTFEWEKTFFFSITLGIILGIILPLSRGWRNKKQ